MGMSPAGHEDGHEGEHIKHPNGEGSQVRQLVGVKEQVVEESQKNEEKKGVDRGIAVPVDVPPQ